MNDLVETDWLVQNARDAYDGRVHITDYAVTLPDGTSSRYEVEDSIPFASAVLLYDGRIHLTRQYRFPLRQWIYDLPGGAGELGETPAEAAMRECEEEVGVVVGDLLELGTFASNPGRTSWRTHLFFCTQFETTGSRQSSGDEDVRLHEMSVHEALAGMKRGDWPDPGLNIALGRSHLRGLLETDATS